MWVNRCQDCGLSFPTRRWNDQLCPPCLRWSIEHGAATLKREDLGVKSMSVFYEFEINRGETRLPEARECGDYVTFAEIYQTNHGHNSFAIVFHHPPKPTEGPGPPTHDRTQIGSINADANPTVRWVEGFETISPREDLGRNQKARNLIAHQEWLPLRVALERMERRSRASPYDPEKADELTRWLQGQMAKEHPGQVLLKADAARLAAAAMRQEDDGPGALACAIDVGPPKEPGWSRLAARLRAFDWLTAGAWAVVWAFMFMAVVVMGATFWAMWPGGVIVLGMVLLCVFLVPALQRIASGGDSNG